MLPMTMPELKTLLLILSNQEALSISIQKYRDIFGNRDSFRVRLYLEDLCRDRLLTKKQEVTAIVILCHEYSRISQDRSYAINIFSLLSMVSKQSALQKLVLQLSSFGSNRDEISMCNSAELYQRLKAMPPLSGLDRLKLQKLEEDFFQCMSSIPSLSSYGMHPVALGPKIVQGASNEILDDDSDGVLDNEVELQSLDSIAQAIEHVHFNLRLSELGSLEPDFITPMPPSLALSAVELRSIGDLEGAQILTEAQAQTTESASAALSTVFQGSEAPAPPTSGTSLPFTAEDSGDIDAASPSYFSSITSSPITHDTVEPPVAPEALLELFQQAQRAPLGPSHQQQILAEMKSDPDTPSFLRRMEFTPLKLPGLVEHNPALTTDLLLHILGKQNEVGEATTTTTLKEGSDWVTKDNGIAHTPTAYLQALVSMEVSLHTMEVVNRLYTAMSLPAEYIHLYISSCISSCENNKDKYMQNRMVRLVCALLQSLLRNKVVEAQDLFVEVQSFCIEFSRIREAASLFKLLKSAERMP